MINDVVAAQAQDRPWVTFIDTAAILGGSDGGYVDRLPGIDQDLRQGDGIHLSRAGADLLAEHLLDLIDEEITAVAPSAHHHRDHHHRLNPANSGGRCRRSTNLRTPIAGRSASAAEAGGGVVRGALGDAELGRHRGGGIAGRVTGVEAGSDGGDDVVVGRGRGGGGAVEDQHVLAPRLVGQRPLDGRRPGSPARSPRGAW